MGKEKKEKVKEDVLVTVTANLGSLTQKNEKTTDPGKKRAIYFQIQCCLTGLMRLHESILR